MQPIKTERHVNQVKEFLQCEAQAHTPPINPTETQDTMLSHNMALTGIRQSGQHNIVSSRLSKDQWLPQAMETFTVDTTDVKS